MASSPPRSQIQLSYAAPASQLDARALRVGLYRAKLLPPAVFQSVAFSGHRHTLNLTAISPDGNAVRDYAADIGLWLASTTGHFAALQIRQQAVTLYPATRPYDYHLDSLVLLRSGKDWTKAADKSWVISRVQSLLHKGMGDFAKTWECSLPSEPPEVTIGGRVLPVTLPLLTGSESSTVLILTAARVRMRARLGGYWHIGALTGSGLGRLWYAARLATPAQIDRENSSNGALMSVEAQLSALS